MAGAFGWALSVNSLRLLLYKCALISGLSHQLRKKCLLITIPVLPKHVFKLRLILQIILGYSARRDCYPLHSSFTRLIDTFTVVLEIKVILPRLRLCLRTTRCWATILLHRWWWSLTCRFCALVHNVDVLRQLFVSFVKTLEMGASRKTVIAI